VVRLHSYQLGKAAGCSQSIPIRILTEHVTRLKHLAPLPHQDCLRMFRQCLIGLMEIGRDYGFDFALGERNVGVDARGDVKVWHSELFSDNYPGEAGLEGSEHALILAVH
jgi:hypothetical protein